MRWGNLRDVGTFRSHRLRRGAARTRARGALVRARSRQGGPIFDFRRSIRAGTSGRKRNSLFKARRPLTHAMPTRVLPCWLADGVAECGPGRGNPLRRVTRNSRRVVGTGVVDDLSVAGRNGVAEAEVVQTLVALNFGVGQ